MADWNSLPRELRDMIVDYIRQDIVEPTQRLTTTARQSLLLPLVSREWHGYFSHVNFCVVVLDQHRLDDFGRIVSDNKPRRRHVQLIVLRINLLEYDCRECQTAESESTSKFNDIIVRDTLLKFMGIMSDWTLDDCGSHRGIELDLGVASPSDSQHDFRNSRDDSDAYPACPGWKRRCRGLSPLLGAKRRITAALGDSQSPHFEQVWRTTIFPSTPVLRRLSIRRRFHRHLSYDIVSSLVEMGLPNLIEFLHETWPCPDDDASILAMRQNMYATTMLASLPLTARTVSLFCDSDAIFQPTPILGAWDFPEIFGEALAEVAQRLEVLSASFILDAECFLHCSSSGTMHYPMLKKLVLTSQYLSRTEMSNYGHLVGSRVLAAANSAHRYMPVLEFLDLWYAKDGDAFLVRITKGIRSLRICWFSTWHALDDQLDEVFGRVGRIWTAQQPELSMIIDRQPFTKIEGDAWYPTGYEELAKCMLHPESMREIAEECGYPEQ